MNIIKGAQMGILFLDDSVTRHDFFCKKQHDKNLRWKPHVCRNEICRVVHVYTAAQAIHQIEKQNFDIVSLDHDLTILDPEENNGFVVARYLAVNFPVDRIDSVAIFLHTWNDERRKAMYKLLSASGFQCYDAPFYVA